MSHNDKHQRRYLSPGAWLLLPMLVFMSFSLQAQLQQRPLYPAAATTKSNALLRTKATGPLSLPFWDDFSTIRPGYPDTLWVNSNSVYISNGSGIGTPSLNAAVFDGLDSLGSPYSPNEPNQNGFTDKLVSRPILLNDVPEPERATVFLSFFYQWRGNGEAPDANDYIRVEFRNAGGAWVEVLTINGGDVATGEDFYPAMIPVAGNDFFHDAFQFRIRSYGRMSGAFDTWIVDYVYLNKGRSASDTSFPDRAAASAMSPLLAPYYAVPYAHFRYDNTLDSVRFDVQNLRGSDFGGASINYRVNANFYQYTGENPPVIYSKNLIKSRGVKGGSGVMLPMERVTVRLDTLPDGNDPLQFNPDADALEVELKMKVISSDSIDPERPAFLPLDFRVNDTLSARYALRDYYAYDDGIGEYSVSLTQPGNRLAYQFELRTDTATLAGFYIYFPYLGGPNTLTADFFVYGNDNGVPSTNPVYSIFSRTITMNGQNEFMYIPMQPPLFLTDSIFYIGYREPVSARVNVGLDKSNDTGDKIFVNVGGTWNQNTDVTGSLMIRPVIGAGGDVITSLPDERPGHRPYPNPNAGVFFVPVDARGVQVTDVTGRNVGWVIEDEDDRRKVTLSSPTDGLYLIRYYLGGGLQVEKVAVNTGNR